MTPENFCFWLQGFFELTDSAITDKTNLSAAQIEVIKQHLALVFKKETPSTAQPQKSTEDSLLKPSLTPKGIIRPSGGSGLKIC